MQATTYLPNVKKTVAVLMALATSVAAFGQANTSFLLNSPLIHSYSHGGLANRNPANNTVGASGVIRTQLSWQNAADLDLRFLLPQGVGSYVGSGLETFPIKNTLFLDTPERQVWAGQKTVVFSNGQAQSSLDRDVRDGIANAPGGQRIENNYLSGNIPSGTYSFAVENYDNSHYYRNNPSAPATNFNIAVTLSGNGYIIPDNTLPLVASTGYAYGVSGSIKDVGAVSPVYSFNFFNPGLDTTHASGIDFFKRFNGNFLPGAYLAMLNVPGMNPAQAPSMVDAMQRMANGQKNQFDSLSVLTNMGEGRLQKEFDKHFATPDSKHNTAQYIDPKTGQAVTVARNDFIKAMWAMNENKALKQQGDAFMASLPEQTRRDFQSIQNQHGNQHTFTELRTADNNFLTNGQVANSVNSTLLRALHSQDAQIAKGIFNDMVANRTTTNAGALFDKNQVMGYDGTLKNVAYIRNHHGQVLQVTEGQLGTLAGQANQQIAHNNYVAQQAKLALQLKQDELIAQSQSASPCRIVELGCNIRNQGFTSAEPLNTPAYKPYSVNVRYVDYKTNWLGYAYIDSTREETLYFKEKATADKVAKNESEKWNSINEQQQYENDHALAYGTIKGISYAGDKVIEGEQKYQVVTRAGGALQAVGGAGQVIVGVTGGVASCPVTFGAGCIGGVALTVNGGDDFWAGISTVATGENVSTVKSKALQAVGVSRGAADITAGLMSVGGTVAYGTVLTRASTVKFPLKNANYAQKDFSQNFSSDGIFAGKTVDELATDIKLGRIDTKEVPIDFIVKDGNTLILNTRSAQALERAGIPRSQWNAIDQTENLAATARLDAQLLRNSLDSNGFSSPTMKINK